MSHTRIKRLRSLQTEFDSVHNALIVSTENWNALQDYFARLEQNLAGLRLAQARLEDTYIIRLFSEFEAILREYCQEIGVAAPYKTESLPKRVVARRGISAAIKGGAHDVRNRRNTIVHGNGAAPAMTFPDALSRLCRFLSWLLGPP